MSAGERRVGGAAGRRSSGRLRRLGQLWVAGAVAAIAVTAASALGWLEPIQVRALDLVQQLGGQRFPPEVVIVAIDEAAFEKLGARQPIPRAVSRQRPPRARSQRRRGRRPRHRALGSDDPGGGRRPRSGDPGARDAGGGAVPGWSWWTRAAPQSGPLADRRSPARGAARVGPGAHRRRRRDPAGAPSSCRRPDGPPMPAFGLAVLAQVAGAAPAAAAAPRALPEDLARYPVLAGRRPGRRRAAPRWRSGRASRGGSTSWARPGASSRSRAMPSPSWASPMRLRSPTTTRSAAAWPSSAPRSPRAATSSRPPSAAWRASRSTPTSCTCWRPDRSFGRPAGWLSLGIQLGVVGVAGVLLSWLRPLAGDARRARAHPRWSACPRATSRSTAAGTRSTSSCPSSSRA